MGSRRFRRGAAGQRDRAQVARMEGRDNYRALERGRDTRVLEGASRKKIELGRAFVEASYWSV